MVFLTIDITISTLAVIYYPHFNLLKNHLFSAIISLALLALGLFLYNQFDHIKSRNKENVISEKREKYFNDVQLLRWWFVPDAKNPKEIHVNIKIAAAGRFAAEVSGIETGEIRSNIFSSDDAPQRIVKSGETIHYVFPLTFIHPGHANSVEFTFYLFKHPVGESGPDDVSKVYKDSIDSKDDGTFFYEKLEPPLKSLPD